MSWLQKLYETYEYCYANASDNTTNLPAPVGQMIQNVQVELMIDAQGNLISAHALSYYSRNGEQITQDQYFEESSKDYFLCHPLTGYNLYNESFFF